ncbi:MAG: TlpA family protein disulfide reductase [Planctomycetota bacterium]|nr:MAG: TlpA family protein disulfide reductase [Planctomycetota bacterium]
MIPAQRKLAEELKGKPFTFLGINSDSDRSGLKERFEKEGVTWPQIYEGNSRAISEKWNVRAYPTLYVIDQQGVIRKRGFLPEPEIAKAVKELLAKTPDAP